MLVLFALLQSAGAPPPSWSEDVRPILAEHCFTCHGPDPATRAARLRLDDREGLAPVVEGGADAELLYRVTSDDDLERMPPPEHGAPLAAADVDVLRRWLEAGSAWEPHWAYAPARAVDVPVPSDPAWVRNAIDAFVLARLDAEGLAPAPPASREALLRRVHLDLTGLPPTEEERARFLADDAPDAYERVIDRLLGSPHFAERWARHWLDIARYADSHGYTIDGGRSIWPWRDWVVQSIHRDQSFDQFTIEQLAGDLLPGATRAQRIATGFHRNTQVNQEGGAGDEENRVTAVMDRVATTATAWLGTTLACAQCHTHKFDPLTHREYYRFYAFLDQTRDGGVSAEPALLVPRTDDEARAAEEWEAGLVELEARLGAARDASAPGWTTWQPPRAWASNGTKLRLEEDGSFLALGQNAVYSTYVLEGAAPVAVAALRLEALPARGLAAGGPGRAGNGNFVLQELRVFTRTDPEGAWEPVALSAARASHEQDTSSEGGSRYPAASLVAPPPEGLPSEGPRGWAIKPRFGEPHAVELTLARPLPASGARELRVELVQEHGERHTLGAFRIALEDTAPDPARALVTDDWRAANEALRRHRAARPGLPTTLVLEAREVPRTTRVFHRGSFLDPRDAVQPGFPAALDHFGGNARGPATRLDLARWLADPRNALVQRVTVNRWWQHLFGRGLVVTGDDLGLRGARPSHPDLLEWLAAELVRGGMSRKHVVRAIVTSSTYRQAARHDRALLERDPHNVLLARQRRMRLEGEVLRDSMLVASGVLEPTVGGPPVQPPQPDGVYAFTQNAKRWDASSGADRYRRSLYTRLWRTAPYPFYSTFDAPAANAACTRRERSTSPLQALALANDPMVQELCVALGARLRELWSVDEAGRIDAAFRWCLGRGATEPEIERMIAHLDAVRDERGPDAGWASVARVLFNLDEFQHRP